MTETTGKNEEFRFATGTVGLKEIQRFAADRWSDLAFDDGTRARFKRDGLALDGVRLTGLSPWDQLPSWDGAWR